MRRYHQSLWTNTLLSIAVSALFGAICTLISTAVFSAFTFIFIGNLKFINIFGIVSLAIGSYMGGLICGKYRRRKGLFEGILCGLFMYLIAIIFGGIIFGATMSIKKLLLLTIFGAIGGVVGVNAKRPEKLRN